MEKVHQKVNGERIFKRIEDLASCSKSTVGVTRLPFTDESKQAEELTKQWMEEAGMTVRRDCLNNIIGRYEGQDPSAPSLIIGSHLDTVIEGGKYDGMLGVISGIEVVQTLSESGVVPNHPIEVIGFCDEEGVRFHTTFLGSKAICGTLTELDLQRKDDEGISIADALEKIGCNSRDFKSAARKTEEMLGYLELHIEQGPVLEENDQPCGVVTGIAGITRFSFTVEGMAGHAGTVPVSLRRDALIGTGEIVIAIENIAKEYEPLVATIGKLSVHPGASNVIPGLVKGTLDIRDIDEQKKRLVIDLIKSTCEKICKSRGLMIKFEKVMEASPVECSKNFNSAIESAIKDTGKEPVRLISGAGHDALALADLTDMGLIFVRCKDGLSHHPDEYVSQKDMEAGAEVMYRTVLKLTSR